MRNLLLACAGVFAIFAHAEVVSCKDDPGAFLEYEREVVRGAEIRDIKRFANGFSCLLKAQNEAEGFARYLSASFLAPILGGRQIAGVPKDPRYKVVAAYLQEIALNAKGGVQESFLKEFSRGDWRFYTLFCEQGNTEYCADFMPDEKSIRVNPPLVAAASMLRLKKAYQTLNGRQREIVGERLKKLHRKIPAEDRLQRKLIDEIYEELFTNDRPLSFVG